MTNRKLKGKIRHKFKPKETVWVFDDSTIYQAKVVSLRHCTRYGRTLYAVAPVGSKKFKEVWGLQLRRPHHDH